MREPSNATTRDPRTEFALDRTVLANERTYAAWLRTGLAALAAGLAIEKLMATAIPAWSIRTIATVLILSSAVAFCLAGWRFTHLGVKLGDVSVNMVPTFVTTLLSVALVACSLTALVALWLGFD